MKKKITDPPTRSTSSNLPTRVRSTGKPRIAAPSPRRRSGGKPKIQAQPEQTAVTTTAVSGGLGGTNPQNNREIPNSPELGSTVVSHDAVGYRNANVDHHVDRITGEDSPLLKRARASGIARAESRGLGNSNLAGQAGESAVYDIALEMASQNAAQHHDVNLSKQNFEQSSLLSDQEFVQESDLADRNYRHNSALSEQGYTQQRGLNDQSFGHQTDLNDQTFGHNRILQSDNNAAQDRRQAADLASRRDLAELDSQTRRDISNADIASRQELAELDAETRTEIARVDANTRIAINEATLTVQERAETGRLLAETDRTYQQTVSTITSNPDIPADVRSQQLDNARDVWETSRRMTAQIYNTELRWPGDNTATPNTAGSAGGTTSGATSSGTTPPIPNIDLSQLPRNIAGGLSRGGGIIR